MFDHISLSHCVLPRCMRVSLRLPAALLQRVSGLCYQKHLTAISLHVTCAASVCLRRTGQARAQWTCRPRCWCCTTLARSTSPSPTCPRPRPPPPQQRRRPRSGAHPPGSCPARRSRSCPPAPGSPCPPWPVRPCSPGRAPCSLKHILLGLCQLSSGWNFPGDRWQLHIWCRHVSCG